MLVDPFLVDGIPLMCFSSIFLVSDGKRSENTLRIWIWPANSMQSKPSLVEKKTIHKDSFLWYSIFQLCHQGRDSGNDIFGGPKPSFICRIVSLTTHNECRFESFLSDTTRNEPCFESFLGTTGHKIVFFHLFCRFYCNLIRLRLETRLLLTFNTYPHTHHPWKDSIIGLLSMKRVSFPVIFVGYEKNEPRFELFLLDMTLNETRLVSFKREPRTNQSRFHYLCTKVFLSTILWNFFLCKDQRHGDVPPHLVQSCYVALGRALVWGLFPIITSKISYFEVVFSDCSTQLKLFCSMKLDSINQSINCHSALESLKKCQSSLGPTQLVLGFFP